MRKNRLLTVAVLMALTGCHSGGLPYKEAKENLAAERVELAVLRTEYEEQKGQWQKSLAVWDQAMKYAADDRELEHAKARYREVNAEYQPKMGQLSKEIEAQEKRVSLAKSTVDRLRPDTDN